MEDSAVTVRAAVAASLAALSLVLCYLAVIVSPMLRVDGYITGYAGLLKYNLTYKYTGSAIRLPSMDHLALIRQILVAYVSVLGGVAVLSIVQAFRRPVDSAVLSFGVYTSLIIVTGVLKMLVTALNYDLGMYSGLLKGEISYHTLAGNVVSAGSMVSYTVAYRLVSTLLPVIGQPILLLAPLAAALTLPALASSTSHAVRLTASGSGAILSGLALAVIVFAALYNFKPLLAVALPAPPVVTFESPSTSVTVVLGANRTSASTEATLSNAAQVLSNPDFESNPDNWYFYSPNNYLSAYWLPSDTGASGGVVSINGSEPALTSDYGIIFQYVTLPSGTIESANITARLRLAGAPFLSLVSYFIGLYDPENESWVAETTGTPSSSYSSYTLSVDPTQVEPGKTYAVAVGVEVSTLFSGTIDFRVDSVYMYVQTKEYTFSGPVLDVSASSQVYARLVLVSYTGSLGDLNATITLSNINGTASTPIEIRGGSVVSGVSGWVPLSPTYEGYHSGTITLDAISTENVSATLYMYLVVSTGSSGPGTGAVEYYPLILTIETSNTRAAPASITVSARPIARARLVSGVQERPAPLTP